MSRGEKVQWIIVLVALASLWPRMIWPHLIWRVVSWLMLAVLAGMFICKMVLFHRHLDEMDNESEDQQTCPPSKGTKPPSADPAPPRTGGPPPGR